MIRGDGFVKLLDFGLAKLSQPGASITDTEAPTKAMVNTAAGTVMGTANYMSPEQEKGIIVLRWSGKTMALAAGTQLGESTPEPSGTR
jgi:serine/threonine protein kinase